MNTATNQVSNQRSTPIEVLRNWFATLSPECLAENISWTVSPGYPVSQNAYTSRREVFEKFFPELRAHFSEWRVETSRFTESGERVVVEGRYIGKVKATGAPIEIDFTHVWTVRNGLIVELNAVADTAQFAKHGLVA
jgi:ketosteroid isomerase-like protein